MRGNWREGETEIRLRKIQEKQGRLLVGGRGRRKLRMARQQR